MYSSAQDSYAEIKENAKSEWEQEATTKDLEI